jgi:hypothetical protein
MTEGLKIYKDVQQNTPEWLALRSTCITASDMHKILTPVKLEPSKQMEVLARKKAGELHTQNFANHQTSAMLMGHEYEPIALEYYEENVSEVEQVGFITNDKWGFKIGFSPDALVGNHGIVEVKSHIPEVQVDLLINRKFDPAHIMQIQTGLLVSERRFCDFIHFCPGLPLMVFRIERDEAYQNKIISACAKYYKTFNEIKNALVMLSDTNQVKFYPTERIIEL